MIGSLRSTFKQSIIYGIGNVSMKLAGLVLLPLYTTKLSVQEFGVLSLIEVTTQLLFSFVSLNLNHAYFRWYYDSEHVNRRKELFFSTTALMTLISLLAGVAIILQSSNLSLLLLGTETYSYLLILMAIAIFLQVIGVNPSYVMMLEEKATLYSFTSLLRMLVILLSTVWLIVVEGRGLNGIYEGQIIGHCFYFIILVPYSIKRSKFGLPVKVLRDMVLYSLPLTLSAVTSVLLSMVDRYILSILTNDLSSVGIYSVAFKIANFIKVFLISSVLMALSPIMMKKMNDPDNKRFYSKIMTYLGFAVLFTALAISIFSLEITKMFARRVEYWEASGAVPILAFGMYFMAINWVAITGLNIAKKSGMIGLSVVIAMLINVALNFMLIPFLDYWGAAISSFIANLVLLVVVYVASQKVFYVPYEVKKLLIMFVVAVAIYAVSIPLNTYGLEIRIPVKILLLILFPLALYYLRQLEPVEIDRMRTLWLTWRNPSTILKNIKRLMNGRSEENQ